MLIEDDGIWFRQSWLDTYMRCSERGRLAIIKPEFDKLCGDAAALGTGAHAGAETILKGGSTIEAWDAIAEAISAEALDPGISYKSYNNIDELIVVAIACFDAWLEEIYPWLVENGWHINARPEMKFKVPIFKLEDGTDVGITGTADLPAEGVVIDWKTSGKPYRQKEKQRFAIQPSIYTWAGVMGAFAPLEFEWPVRFYYGVMVRPSKVGGMASTQIVPVERTEAHARWALKQIKSALRLAQTSLGTEWPTHDEGNYLCSAKWCPWHSICRGAVLSPEDDEVVPVELVKKAA